MAVVTPRKKYEFTLVSIGSNTAKAINGLWDIRRNGILVCEGCIGQAYNLEVAVGDYFKIYIGDAITYSTKWHYSAYITNRFDF